MQHSFLLLMLDLSVAEGVISIQIGLRPVASTVCSVFRWQPQEKYPMRFAAMDAFFS